MAISIGDAVLKLGVDTKSFDKGMTGLTGRIKQHRKAIGLAMVGIGASIIAVGVSSIKTWAAMGDEIGKMSRKIGFSTVTLSELKHAAELSGGSLTGVEKAVKKMAMSISDAKDGLATYIREFEKIGVNVIELENLSPEEQFLKIAYAIAAVEDPMQRLSSAQKIFGRAGADLLPMLDQGAEGLDKMRQAAHDLNVVFEDTTAAEEFTDAMLELEKSITGIKKTIAEELAPQLKETIDSITGMVVAVSKLAREYPGLTSIIVKGSMVFAGLLIAIGGVMVAGKLLLPVISLIGLAISALMGPIGLLIAGLGMIAWGIFQIFQNKAKTKKYQDAYMKALEGEHEAYVKLLEDKENLTEVEQIYLDAVKASTEATETNTAAVEENDAATAQLGDTLEDVSDTTKYMTELQRKLEQAYYGSAGAVETLTAAQTYNAMRARELGIGFGDGGPGGAGWESWRGFQRGRKEEELGLPPGSLPPSWVPEMTPEGLGWNIVEPPGGWEEFQHGGIISKPTLALMGEQAPRIKEAVIPESMWGKIGGSPNVIVHVYLGGDEFTDLIVDQVTEKVKLQGGL